MDRANTRQTTAAEEAVTKPLAAFLRQLEEFGAPSRRRPASWVRGRARIQAVRWREELEATERLDESWPAFEAWLREDPENHRQFLLSERAQLVIEDLGRACPKEGSQAAMQLLKLRAKPTAAQCYYQARAKWLVLSVGVVVLGTAVLCWARHLFG